MNRPKTFDVLVYFHDQKPITTDFFLELFGKLRHIFVRVDNYKGNLIVFKAEVVGHAPFAFM